MTLVDEILSIIDDADKLGYVLLPDDYTALGYVCRTCVVDQRRIRFAMEQFNNMIEFITQRNGDMNSLGMKQNEDGEWYLVWLGDRCY